MKKIYILLFSLCAVSQLICALKPESRYQSPQALLLSNRTDVRATQSPPSLDVRGIDERIEKISDLIILKLKVLFCCRKKKPIN